MGISFLFDTNGYKVLFLWDDENLLKLWGWCHMSVNGLHPLNVQFKWVNCSYMNYILVKKLSENSSLYTGKEIIAVVHCGGWFTDEVWQKAGSYKVILLVDTCCPVGWNLLQNHWLLRNRITCSSYKNYK